ncbi:MAG TPA: PIN domain nuclease [Vicinamibacterales bacterium]|nr:PIN domain nuclease [Vicinamibacterales bacterium]
MVIVDSTVWVDYFNGLHNPETDWLEVQLDQQRLGLTTLILCEVLQGVRDERKAVAVETDLMKLEVFEMPSVVLAVQAGKHYRTLRSRGRTVRKTIDVLIATFCIEEQHSLLHRDRDFDPFEELLGLSVVHP